MNAIARSLLDIIRKVLIKALYFLLFIYLIMIILTVHINSTKKCKGSVILFTIKN